MIVILLIHESHSGLEIMKKVIRRFLQILQRFKMDSQRIHLTVLRLRAAEKGVLYRPSEAVRKEHPVSCTHLDSLGAFAGMLLFDLCTNQIPR